MILTSELTSVSRVYLVETASPDRVHPAELQSGAVKLPKTLRAGTTYHLAFETKEGVVAFLATKTDLSIAPPGVPPG